jgi:hypothetical protein
MKTITASIVLFVSIPTLAAAKGIRTRVHVVAIEAHNTSYSFMLPGYARTDCSASAFGSTVTGGCSTVGQDSAGLQYTVRGATLSLLLPDGRMVVANCDSKTNWGWSLNPHRSCRVPLQGTVIDADFNGSRVKLKWSVSLDGRKKEGETYKILGILGVRKN